jgi:hypothetical protein
LVESSKPASVVYERGDMIAAVGAGASAARIACTPEMKLLYAVVAKLAPAAPFVTD